jgi:cytochrome c biogenesis protein
MTHEVNSRPLRPAAAAQAAIAGPTAMDRVDRVLEWLWHFLSSMRLAMVLMLGIAVLAIPGTLLRQIPAVTLADPQAHIDWLDSVRPFYAGWTNVLDTLQLFNVFNSVPFNLLVAVLTVSLIACSVHRFPGLVRTAVRPRVDVGPAFFEHAPQHEVIVARAAAADTRAAIEGVLRTRHYRTVVLEAAEDGIVHFYADRHRWLSFSGLFAHLAIVAIIAGALVGATTGYRDPDFAITEGATRQVVAEPGLGIQLLDFTDKYDTATGMPLDYASQVVVWKNGVEVDRHTIRVNDPLRVDGYTFYQQSFGASAVMTIKDAAGAQVASEGIPFAWQVSAEERPLGIYSIPGSNYVLWVLGTTGGGGDRIQPGQVEVQVFNSGENTPVDDKVIDQGKPATVAGMTMSFDRESQYTRLNVARDPGLPLVWGGALVLFAGFAIRFLLPHKRLWGRIVARPNGGAVIGVATLTSKDVASGTEFEHIVNDIRAALQLSAKG